MGSLSTTVAPGALVSTHLMAVCNHVIDAGGSRGASAGLGRYW
jgi:hypothetical protein